MTSLWITASNSTVPEGRRLMRIATMPLEPGADEAVAAWSAVSASAAVNSHSSPISILKFVRYGHKQTFLLRNKLEHSQWSLASIVLLPTTAKKVNRKGL